MSRKAEGVFFVFFGVVTVILAPIWIPSIALDNLKTSYKKWHKKKQLNGMVEGRDMTNDRNFKMNMELVYDRVYKSQDDHGSDSILITKGSVSDYLRSSIKLDVISDGYETFREMHVYKNYNADEYEDRYYMKSEILEMVIKQLKKDGGLIVERVTTLDDFDYDKEINSNLVSYEKDCQMFKRMLDKSELWRVSIK